MILYFADRQLNILGMASTKLKKGIEIVSDLKVEDTESGVASFEATFSYSRENRRKVEECTRSGNYILRKNGKENEFYTITESESDTGFLIKMFHCNRSCVKEQNQRDDQKYHDL